MKNSAALKRRYAGRRRGMVRCLNGVRKVAAFLVTRPVDVSYLSGFTGEDSAILVSPDRAMLITDFRFSEQAPRECPGADIRIRPSTRTLEQETARVARELGLRSLGVQQDHMTLGQQLTLTRALKKTRIVPVEDVLMKLRRIKDEEEIQLTRKTVRIAEKAFKELIGQGVRHFTGKTERQLAAELEWRMRMAGADGTSFEMIVAAGPNGSMCHYRPGNRKVKRQDVVLFDWGAELDGYRSDITRVVFLGEPSAKFREIYDVVLKAHDTAVKAIKPGIRCNTVDACARQYIANAGYGEYFGHGLGHGIGREIHEHPRFSPKSKDILRKNMIMTVEPGIYLPGVGGVRIEDDILVTAGGHERLNKLPRRIESMILRR